MTSLMPVVFDVSIFNISDSSNIIGPLATLHIVGPDIFAYATWYVVDADESVICTLTVLSPDSFVNCIFCIIALASDGAV